MAKLKWAVLCQRVITDASTNYVSYIDTVEGMSLPHLPHLMLPFIVGTLWERDFVGEVITVRVGIADPDGKVIASLGPGELRDEHAMRHRTNVSVFISSIEKAGAYAVLVEQFVGEEWRVEASISLQVAVHEASDEVHPADGTHSLSDAEGAEVV